MWIAIKSNWVENGKVPFKQILELLYVYFWCSRFGHIFRRPIKFITKPNFMNVFCDKLVRAVEIIGTDEYHDGSGCKHLTTVQYLLPASETLSSIYWHLVARCLQCMDNNIGMHSGTCSLWTYTSVTELGTVLHKFCFSIFFPKPQKLKCWADLWAWSVRTLC